MAELEVVRGAFVPADLEIRSDGRTVHGILVPFGEEATVNDGAGPYRERFARGAFARQIGLGQFNRIKLLLNHDRANPIGVATALREDSAGLYGEFHVSEIGRGDEALTLVRDRVLDAFSVGFSMFEGRGFRKVGDVVERTEVKLNESSLVPFPAYVGAIVGGVRTLGTPSPEPVDPDTSAGPATLETDDQASSHSTGYQPNERERLLALLDLETR